MATFPDASGGNDSQPPVLHDPTHHCKWHRALPNNLNRPYRRQDPGNNNCFALVRLHFPSQLVTVQSMGALPCFSRISLHLEKCLHPKKPRCADRPEGCTVSSTECPFGLMAAFRVCACLPQSMNTKPFCCWLTCAITASVNFSHPFFECDPAFFSCTPQPNSKHVLTTTEATHVISRQLGKPVLKTMMLRV